MPGAAARPARSLLSTRGAPGEMLRSARLARHLTMRDVAVASKRLATRFDNHEFHISLSYLSEIEASGALPNLYRLCSLSMIYGVDLLTLVAWFIPELSAGNLSDKDKERILFAFPNTLLKGA